MTISHISNNINLIKYLDFIQIFLSSINLIIKGVIISVYFNTDKDDNHQELTRIIIYEFFSTQLLTSFIMESDIKIYFYFFLQNLSLIIVSIFYTKNDRYYLFDTFASFFTGIIFFLIRKEWDLNMRLMYSEKYKFQVFFNYTFDYLNGLNCFIINVKDDKNIFYQDKLAKLLIKYEFCPDDNLNDPKNSYNTLFDNDPTKKKNILDNYFHIENLDENSPFIINMEKFFNFANNLTFYKADLIKDSNNDDQKTFCDNMKNEEIEILECILILNKLKYLNIFYYIFTSTLFLTHLNK